MRLPNNLDHALAVINLYFTVQPSRWMYEPVERFNHLGREMVWNPDCIFSHQRKLYVCELQLTPITQAQWTKRKWTVYNLYFGKGYFHQAAFQQWGKGMILPQFIAISNQQAETVKSGFNITGRELIVMRSITGI